MQKKYRTHADCSRQTQWVNFIWNNMGWIRSFMTMVKDFCLLWRPLSHTHFSAESVNFSGSCGITHGGESLVVDVLELDLAPPSLAANLSLRSLIRALNKIPRSPESIFPWTTTIKKKSVKLLTGTSNYYFLLLFMLRIFNPLRFYIYTIFAFKKLFKVCDVISK